MSEKKKGDSIAERKVQQQRLQRDLMATKEERKSNFDRTQAAVASESTLQIYKDEEEVKEEDLSFRD